MPIIFRNGVPYGGTGDRTNIVTGISIDVKSYEEKTITLEAKVFGRGRFSSEVIWRLTGNMDGETKIDSNGVVKIGEDEIAKSLIVTATSVQDDTISSVASIIQMDLVTGGYVVSDFTFVQ